MRNRHSVSYLIPAVLALAIVLRATPTIVYGQPFSTDVWPLIRATEIIIERPGVRIWCDHCFDGYNNRWPGVILSASVLGLAVGLEPRYLYCFIHLIAVSLAYATLLYLLLKRLVNHASSAVLGLLYFVSVPSLLVFSSSVLKEVYSFPFIFILLTSSIDTKRSATDLITIFIASAALTLSHPLATAMTVGFMASTAVVIVVLSALGMVRENAYSRILSRITMFVAVLLTLFMSYYALYGRGGFGYSISVDDIATYLVYAFFVYLSYTVSNHIGKKKILSVFATLFAIAITFVVVTFSITYGVSFEKSDIAPYVLSATIPLVLLCFLPREIDIAKVFSLGIAFFLSTTIAYAYITKPEFTDILHRVLNYVSLLNAITVSYVVSRSTRTSVKVLTIAIVIAVVVLGTLCMISLVLGRDNTIFYWVYRESEVHGFRDIAVLTLGGKQVLGDSKVFYFLKMTRAVDTLSLVNILYRNGAKCCLGSVAVLYSDNLNKGYVTSLTIHSLDVQGFRSVLRCFNRVYDIGTVVGLEVV